MSNVSSSFGNWLPWASLPLGPIALRRPLSRVVPFAWEESHIYSAIKVPEKLPDPLVQNTDTPCFALSLSRQAEGETQVVCLLLYEILLYIPQKPANIRLKLRYMYIASGGENRRVGCLMPSESRIKFHIAVAEESSGLFTGFCSGQCLKSAIRSHDFKPVTLASILTEVGTICINFRKNS